MEPLPLQIYLEMPWREHYAPDAPGRIDVPDISVGAMFDEAAKRVPERPAIIFYGREITFSELLDATERLANAFTALGLKKGDRIALYLLNSPQFVIAYFAALKCGAVVTAISPVFTSHEIRFQIEDSGARFAVCQDVLYDKLARSGTALDFVVVTKVGEYLPLLKRFIGNSFIGKLWHSAGLGSASIPKQANILWLQDLLRKYPAKAPQTTILATDLAALPYTGGTTGNPKGVMLSHGNLVAAKYAASAAFPQLIPGKEVLLAFLPFFHIYGQVAIMLNGLCQGNVLVLFTTPNTGAILSALERHRATVFFGVPTLYEYLKDHKDTEKVDWRRLKLLLSGADTLHASTVKAWEERTGTSIVEGYGLTESCAASHLNPSHRPKSGSFGCPIPNVCAAVINPDNGSFLPPDTQGELVLSGPNVMQGYWKRPEETAQAFLEAGGRRWLRTGDLVSMDPEGYFHFFDRAKDLIKHKGYSIFAKEVEDVLYGHPQVKSAGVIGVSDAATGQQIKAIVVLHSDARGRTTEDELRRYCEAHLAHYKVPQRIEFRGELPKTDVGKVSRRELREEVDSA